MAVIKSILHHGARLQPAGFARLTLFLGVILLATPLRQERRIFGLLLQLMFLDALLVSLSAGDTRQRLSCVFFGGWASGFGADLGATFASRVESIQWWSLGASNVAFMLQCPSARNFANS